MALLCPTTISRLSPVKKQASVRIDADVMAWHLSNQRFQPVTENMVIVNGAQHGLAITVMGPLRPGDIVAVDALTYPGSYFAWLPLPDEARADRVVKI